MRGTRTLVTGGSGFIGSRLVRALLDEGAVVTVADQREFPDPRVRTVSGDLTDPAVRDAVVADGTEVIVHLAAVTSVLRTMDDPVGTHQMNVEVTAGLLELARVRGTGRFLLASTNAVTGDVGSRPISEDVPLRPLTPYGSTKAAAEMLLSGYSASYGLTGAALRFANVYGPGMAHRDSFVSRLMRAAASDRGVQIYGDGMQLRDYVHVDDVVQAILLALRTGHSGPLVVGSGRSDSVNDLVAAARTVTGAAIPVSYMPAKQGEMPAVVLDITAARALGYSPRHTLASGLATAWPEFTEGTSVDARARHS
jgi:UDP-glucose 4-epimerase